jgi:multicomponent Na+:H+ antiporter subunit D
MSPELAIQFCLFVPLIGALGILLTGYWPNIRETVTLTTAFGLFLLVMSLYGPVQAGERPEVTLLELMPGLNIKFVVEPLGMLFAMIASGLWIVTSVYAIGYMRGHHEQNQTRFFICFAVAISSTLGIAFAGNLLTLFVFYEILTFSTYPLVTHAGTENAKKGGRVYLGILVFTSIAFQMPAIIWTYNIAGTLDFTLGGILKDKADPALLSLLLLLFVFGIGKAALMPFHRWLPAAMVAPTPVSALLHAVAVVKAGVFSVLKVVVFTFGIDVVSTLDAGQFLTYVAAATIMIGSLVAMRQDNLKRRLAYSTISQLSYIVLGAMLATDLGIIGGGMHIATHAFGKITLFFCAGAIMVASHRTEVSQLDGLGRAMPFTFAAFFIGAVSIIGLPPMGGVWSKWYLALGALQTDQLILVAVLMISSLLNVAYLLPIPIKAFFGDPANAAPVPDDGHGHHDDHPRDENEDRWALINRSEAPTFCVLAQGFTAVGCLALFIWPEPIYQLLGQLVGK